MRQAVDDKLRVLAHVMRKNATNAERRMWSKLRDGRLGGLKFRRQVPIGRAIADFVCYEHKLIVEVDGGQHSENRPTSFVMPSSAAGDFASSRFWNIDVMRNTEGVLATIRAAARETTDE